MQKNLYLISKQDEIPHGTYIISKFIELESSIHGTLVLLDEAPDNLKHEEGIILKDFFKYWSLSKRPLRLLEDNSTWQHH